MTIHLDIENGLATVVFDSPATNNAMDAATAPELNWVTQRITAEPSVRVVLLRAQGPVFGVGGSITSFLSDLPALPEALRELGREINPAIARLRSLPAVVVAAVHGAVAGGSIGIMSAADLVIAAQGTKFNLAYARLGASPDIGNSWFLPRLVGTRRALELLMLSDNFDAEAALRYGLVNQVVPAEELRAATEALVTRLLAGPSESYARIKRLVYQSEQTPLAQQLDDEIENFAQIAVTPDFAEGVKAFIEKRLPQFGKP